MERGISLRVFKCWIYCHFERERRGNVYKLRRQLKGEGKGWRRRMRSGSERQVGDVGGAGGIERAGERGKGKGKGKARGKGKGREGKGRGGGG